MARTISSALTLNLECQRTTHSCDCCCVNSQKNFDTQDCNFLGIH